MAKALLKSPSKKTSQWLMPSTLGAFYLVASEEGLEGLFWTRQSAPMAPTLKGRSLHLQILSQAVQELDEYLLGRRHSFSVLFNLKGTPFQKKVWKQLRKIPFGKTMSYKEVAFEIKNEKAVRAVGTAIGMNPLCILIPCHRVIASDGTLGGYSGGLSKKKKLLKLEGL